MHYLMVKNVAVWRERSRSHFFCLNMQLHSIVLYMHNIHLFSIAILTDRFFLK